jgi:hypothetical protein
MFTFGDAKYYGSLGSQHLTSPVVGIAVTPDGKGYWMVTAAGAVYHFGSAKYYGQPLALHPRSIVQIAPTPTGKGYFVLSSDSHLYTYGDAKYHGAPIGRSASGIAVTPDGRGYWIGARNGAVATYGNAPYYGQFLGASAVAIAGSDPFLDPSLLQFSASGLGTNRGRLVPTGRFDPRGVAASAAP